VSLAEYRETREAGVDEHHAPGAVDGELVDVEIAGDLAVARHVQPVEMLVGALGAHQDVFQAPDLVDRRHIDPIAVAPQPHGAGEIALMHRETAIGQHADEEQLAGLIRGERQADAVHQQPVDQPARAADVGRGVAHGRRRRHRGGGWGAGSRRCCDCIGDARRRRAIRVIGIALVVLRHAPTRTVGAVDP
jgi:hypothetical protein